MSATASAWPHEEALEELSSRSNSSFGNYLVRNLTKLGHHFVGAEVAAQQFLESPSKAYRASHQAFVSRLVNHLSVPVVISAGIDFFVGSVFYIARGCELLQRAT